MVEPHTTEKGRILVVDDDGFTRRVISESLHGKGYTVEDVDCGEAAAEAIKLSAYDVIITDIVMPGIDGLEFLRIVREYDLNVPVMLITGNPSLETAIKAIEYGAFRYLLKPLDITALVQNVENACRLARIAKAKREATELLISEKQIDDRAGLERTFKSALEKVWIAFQPIVRWSDRSLHGYECLLRSDEEGLCNPADLLDAAERLDRVHELGHTIRSKILNSIHDLDEKLKVFVNLHPIDLTDDALFDENSEFSSYSHRMVLEITERASLDRVTNVRGKIARLKDLGFCIAVDDLGAGYAGLTSFTQLEPHVVKLDMSLVRNVHLEPIKIRLVESIVEVCKELKIAVVAEGIEYIEERDKVAELGCDLLQGYFFAKPGRAFPTIPPEAWE